MNPSTSTTALTDTIEYYTKEYQLEEYLQRKIRWEFGHVIETPYTEFLHRFLHTDSELGEPNNEF